MRVTRPSIDQLRLVTRPYLRLLLPLLLAVLASLSLLVFLPEGQLRAAGVTHYVAPGANCGGVSPCYATIQAAIDTATTDDQILVAAGLYTGVTPTAGSTQTVYLNKTVTLRGGYTTANWTVSNPDLNPTILDAQNLGRVIFVDAASPTIAGFEIRNGASTGSSGGGIFLRDSNAIIRANKIYSNTVVGAGAGVSNGGGSPRLERNKIFGNTASGAGGGLFNVFGSLTSQNNLFYNNQAAFGGGVDNEPDSTFISQNDTFYGNRATGGLAGGGIVNFGTLAVTNTIIFNNVANSGAGGINNSGGSATASIDHSTVFSNTAPNLSGGVTETNPVNINPQVVVSPATGDINILLQSSSPVRNAGLTLSEVSEDYQGHGRPFNAAYDIGADEFTDLTGTCFARLDNGQVYTSVQQATDVSAGSSLIQVAGTCLGVTNKGGFNQTLYIDHNLTVRGGYSVTNWTEPVYGPTLLNANGAGRGIYVTDTATVTLESLHVTGGLIAGNGAGVYLGNDGGNILINNVIYGNQATGSGDGGGLFIDSSGTTVVQHNTIHGNSSQDVGGGVYVTNNSGPVTLANTNVTGNVANTAGGVFDVGGGSVSLRYNNFFQNTPTNYGNVTTGTNDISVQPGYTSAAGGNFHLDFNTSAVTNRADPASPVATDFENDPRPLGSRPDIGADESRFFADVDINTLTLPINPRVVTDTGSIANTLITFTHTVTNLSNLGQITDTFTIATSNSDGWNVSLVGINSPVVLTTGVPVNFSVVVSVPGTVPSTLFNRTALTITAQSNPNVFDTTVDIIANPSLELTPNYTATADPGQVLTFTHILTNSGPVIDTIDVSLTSPLGWATLVAPTSSITLTAGQSIPVIVRVQVVDTAPANLADVITITATSPQFGISVRATDIVTANATTGDRYVAIGGTNFNNNCTRENTPCAGISHAINQAAFGDTVFVAQGTYNDTNIGLVLDVDLKGGYLFDGNTFTLPGGGVDPTTTIINAAGGRGIRVDVASAFHPEINGFTIRNASTSGVGGALYLQNFSAPILRNLIILQSTANQGAGIYIDRGNPILDHVTINGVTASAQGGGIYVNTGSPQMGDVVISNTIASSGGGIYLAGGSSLITGSTIYSASVTGDGGGLYQNGGTLTAYKLTLINNRAGDQGGGVYRFGGTATISQTQIGTNTAHTGGGLYNNAGTLNLWNNFIYSNTTTTGGGGGVFNAATLNVINNTLHGNQASGAGGGVFNSSSLVISNTILAFNGADDGGGIRHSGGSATLAYNNVFNNTGGDYSGLAAGPNSISANPLFTSLDPVDPGFLRLAFNSPSVDTAAPNTFLVRDIEDHLRPVNQGFDMGADEVSGCLARLVRTDTVYGVLQDAIDDSISNDTIQITGICRGVLPKLVAGQTISQTALITKNLNLEGGYDVTFQPTGDPTILDAQGQGRTVVVTGSTLISVKLTNLQLTGGNASGLGGKLGSGDAGGGLYSNNVILNVVGSVISDSLASYGGGLYALNGNLTLGGSEPVSATHILSNTATFGGGIYLERTTHQGEYLLIQDNTAIQDGGGFYNADVSSGIISNTSIYSNSAGINGGGIYNTGPVTTSLLTAQVITSAYNTANNGAGAYNASGGRLILSRAILLDNEANTDGGGVYNVSAGTLALTNTIVASNTATGDGAGVHNLAANFNLYHGTFYRNIAGSEGGAIYYNAGGPPRINSTLVVSNSAASGGGLFTANSADASLIRYNDFAANTPNNYAGVIGNQTNINGNISASVQFLSTNPADPGFLRIPGGSPAEDKGDPASPVLIDIEEDPRPSNQNPDIGVDEVSNCFVRINGLPPTYGNIQVAINTSASGDELRVAGLCQGVNLFVDASQTVSQTIFLTKSLTIRGGYTNQDWDTQDLEANPTFLDALSLGRVAYITNSAQITIDGLRLSQGNSATNGGAVFVGSGALTMTRSAIYSSTAANGGGLYNAGGAVHLLDDNEIYSNTATTNGGAFYNASGTILLEDNLIRHNQAVNRAGAFYHNGGNSTLWNNVIRNNSANQGGAIYNNNTNLTVWHNTFASNSSSSNGAGFLTTQSTGVSLLNNIFFNHLGPNVVHSTVAFTVQYNDIFPTISLGGGATAGTNVISVDPSFINAAGGDFHIALTSTVVDQGSSNVTLTTDFDNDTTPRDLRPGGQGFDMGADEVPGCLARIVREPAIIYGNIQVAINNSVPGDTIQVTGDRECGGVHPFNTGSQIISQTAHITHNLTLVGGFRPDFSGFLSPTSQTVLNPMELGRALLVTGTTQVTMQRFLLQNGLASGLGGGPSGNDAGGGIYYQGVGGSFSNVTVYSNTATFGGGIYNAGAGLTFVTSVVQSNTATTNGGGIYNANDALELVDTEIFDNQAGNNGGGIFNAFGVMNLEGNDIFDNIALRGGGLYNNNSASVLDFGNNFYQNTATAGGGGGAIYNNNGALIIQNNFLYRNQTANEGGAIFVEAGNPNIRHNTFYNNSGTEGSSRGGAIYLQAGNAFIQNNIFDSNTVTSPANGTAIFRAGGSPTLQPNAYWPQSATNQVVGIAVNDNLNIHENPNYVDVGDDDYQLSGGSPLIDHELGATLTLDHDFQNDPRPINLNVEMGADEYNDCLVQVAATEEIYGNIQPALDAAPSGTEVRVALGRCFERITINKEVTLTGRWRKDFSAQDDDFSTVIDASASAGRVVDVEAVPGTVNIQKITVTNGTVGGNGGGIRNRAAALNLVDIGVISNTANSGGGISHESGTLTISGLSGVGLNRASGNGGGIYIASGLTATIAGVAIDENQALGGSGGAIYNDANSTVDIIDGGMDGNSANVHGGAVYNAPGSTVEIGGGFSIQNNVASSNGGGIYNNAATLDFRQKRVNDNRADHGGGIFITGASQVTSENLGLFGNEATDPSGDGGGIFREGTGSTTIYHATMHTNVANDQGGAIHNAGNTMVVSASIIALNEAPNGGSGINGIGSVNVAYSLRGPTNSYVGVNLGSGNLQDMDPRLREPGGDLEYDSPAIDAVPASASGVEVDRFLQPRSGFPISICDKDMGRDEFNINRQMTWLTPNNPVPAEALVAPTQSVTYTFFLRNESENLTPDNSTSLGLGTGYTETVTVTLNSDQGWAAFIEDPALGIISGTISATFELGPGETAPLQVMVTVPPGQTATVAATDTPKDSTFIDYVASLCEGQPVLTGDSPAAITRVEANRSVIFEPDQTGGPALPGQTITFTHILTNTGNITDTYIIAPSALLYTSGEVLTPSTYRVENVAPGMTSTVVVSVTIDPAAAGGLVGRANFAAIAEDDPTVSDTVVDIIPILFTTGTRHVSLQGTNSLVNETSGTTDTTVVDVTDNNCTQPQLGACRTIQHALSQAAPGDLIKIEQGTYSAVYSDILTVTHQSQVITQVAFIDKSITLQGGYSLSNWDQSPPNHISQTTILELQDLGRAIYIATTDPVTIDRLTLRNGNATGLGGEGGLIYNEGADLTLHANRLQDGNAVQGGALYHEGGDLLLQNNMIHGNTATGAGGALFLADGQAALENNTFYNNQAGDGGALRQAQGNLALNNTIFADNTGSAVSVAGPVNPTGNFNLFDGNTPNDYVDGGAPGVPPGPNNASGDPFFVNPAANPPNLHIQSGSAARDQANPATTLNIDYDNDPRPLPPVGGFDIGADERLPVQSLLFYSSTFTSTSAGNQVVITHILQNTGDVTDTYTIDASSTQAWTITFDQALPYTITLTPGLSQTVVVTYNVPLGSDGQTNLTVITATSSLSSVFDINTDEIKVRGAAWEITKQVTPDTFIEPGGRLTYTISITNIGDLDSAGATITVTDELPNDTNFVSGTPTPNTTNPVQWVTNTNVLTGQSLSFSFVVTVTQPLTDGWPIVNDVYSVVGGGVTSPTLGSPVTVTVEAGALLDISKSANTDLVQPGDFLTYTIAITNAPGALAPASNVVVTDTLPAEAVFQSMGFVSPATGVVTPTGNNLAWELADALQPGSSAYLTVTVRITSPLAAPATLTNTFGISASNIDLGLDGSLTTALTATNSITMSKAADPVDVAAGETVTYTITLTNSGNGIATVTLTDTLAPGFSPATFNQTILVPGRDWVTDGVTTLSFTATVPITGGNYTNPLLEATYEITDVVLVDTAPITVAAAITGLTLTNDSPTSLGQLTTLTTTITGGNDVSYALDFGDGSPVVTGTLLPGAPVTDTYTYPAPGVYTAIVTATNNVSVQVATTTVIIEEDITGLTLVNDSPTLLGQPTLLTATITDGTNVTYALDFGDGQPVVTGTLLAGVPLPVNHTYGNVGTFTATITATNGTSSQVATTSVTIIVSPPFLIAPPNGTLTNTQTINFVWSSTGVPTYTLDLDGTLFNVTNTSTTTIVAEGVHTWTVASIDALGQQSVFTDVWTFTVDVTPPTVPTPTSPLTGSFVVTNAFPLVWDASTDNLSGVVSYTIRLTGTTGTTVTTVGAVTSLPVVLADGIYTWTIQAVDGAGNRSAFSPAHRFEVNTQAPTKPVLILPPNGSFTNTSTVNLTWLPSAPPAVTYTIYLSGNTFLLPTPGTNPVVSPTVLAEGVYTWTVEATDSLGRSSGVTDTWTFTVDVTPPTVPVLISPTAGQTVLTNTVPFTWGASTDNLSGVVTYTLVVTGPSGTTTVNLGNVTSTVLNLTPDGVYTWTVQAIDAAGNPSGFSPPVSFTIDATGPDKPILIAPPDGTVTTSLAITLEWGAVTQATTYTLHLNGSTFNLFGPGPTIISPTVLPEGVYTWTVEAIDDFGRTSGVTDTWTFTIDQTPPPVPTLIAPPNGTITSTNPLTFSWSNVGPDADHYNLQLTFGATTTVLGPFAANQALVNLPFGDGVYTWTVEAVDAAGNTSGFTDTWTVTLDTTPPTALNLLTPANGAVFTQSGNITFSWTTSIDALSGPVIYTLNIQGQAPQQLGTTSQTVNITTDGIYTWTVSARDQLGNTVVTGTRFFEVDLTPPAAPFLIAPPDGTLTRTNNITFDWSAITDTGTLTYTLLLTDPVGAFQTFPTSVDNLNLLLGGGDGLYTWTVRVDDRFGRSAITDTWNLTIDTTPPTSPTLISPPDGTVFTTTNVITFEWTASTDAFSPISYTLSISGQPLQVLTATSQALTLPEGVYTWTVSATDPAGNTSITDTWTFEIDNNAPPKPRLIAPPNLTYTNNPNVNFRWRSAADTVTYTLKLNDTLYPVLAPATNRFFTNLPEGVYTWTVRAIDAYSRTLGYTDSWQLVVDLTPPSVPALISPTNGAAITTTARPVFDWTDATDALSGPVTYTLTITGPDGVPTTYPVNVSTFTPGTDLPLGAYTWSIQVFDRAGNSSSAGPFTFTIQAGTTTLYLPLLVKLAGGPPTQNRPDLVIDNITVSKKSGNTYTVRVTARNQSATAVTFGNNFYVNLYMDGNTATPIIIWGVQASWFGAGQSRVLEQDYTFPGGVHTVQAWADAFDTVAESNENNNTRNLSITISGGAQNVSPKSEPRLPAGPQPTPTVIPGSN